MSGFERYRDKTIHQATPGHWWTADQESSAPKTSQKYELNPVRLDLDNLQHFMMLLEALVNNEDKAKQFLANMPQWRIDFLKKKHAGLSPQLNALNPPQKIKNIV